MDYVEAEVEASCGCLTQSDAGLLHDICLFLTHHR